MTPKEKAKELISKYLEVSECGIWNGTDIFIKLNNQLAKQCALIAVDEILEASLYQFDEMDKYVIYWQQVKQEIEKL